MEKKKSRTLRSKSFDLDDNDRLDDYTVERWKKVGMDESGPEEESMTGDVFLAGSRRGSLSSRFGRVGSQEDGISDCLG